MKLSQILNGLDINYKDDCEIAGIDFDSRRIKENYLFVAIKGLISDGHNYLNQAREKGACMAIVEEVNSKIAIEQIKVRDSRMALSLISANYFENPTEKLNLIGVTGTNGKTTVTFMLESIFKALGRKTGLIGTVRVSIGNHDYKVEHTTPESLKLQEYFHKMVSEQVDIAIIEASSHAIDLHRVDNCNFNQVIFTNLTQDHFDYHKNFENYFKAKSRLFEINPKAKSIINSDDEYGSRLINLLNKQNVISYGIDTQADYQAFEIQSIDNVSKFKVKFKDNIFQFTINQLGLFNVYNALAAISSTHQAGHSFEEIQLGFDNLINVVGRFELIRISSPYKVIVDYAHTPDGLENLLKAARNITKGRLITVFGCGGDRDKGKRPKMGLIAKKLSDLVIVTSDNPRGENPDSIIKEIINSEKDYILEADRYLAINKALEEAKPGDVVVIAGKGHENTQEINGEHFHFSDKEAVEKIWSKIKGS